MRRAALISSLGFLAALGVGGCGIDAKNVVTQLVKVPTTTNFARTATTETTAQAPTSTSGGPAAGAAAGAAGAASGTGGENITPPPQEPAQAASEPIPPDVAISYKQAEIAAAKTATAIAHDQGDDIPTAAWQVSCYGSSKWTCSVSYLGCAGTIIVEPTERRDIVRGVPQDFGCAD